MEYQEPMMNLYEIAEILFWSSAAVVAYTCVIYPLVIAVLARFRARPIQRAAGVDRSVSVLLAAWNEEKRIAGRLQELIGLLDAGELDGEVVLVADGCTDDTVRIARGLADDRIRVVELPQRLGKAVALAEGAKEARGDILILADVRQTWDADAVRLLLENFADPAVGAVSGELMIESAPGVLAGVGLYWRFEKWMRRQESALHSTVGVTGAIAAVRRELFRPAPAGTILDDVWWPLLVTLQGYRVVFDGRAQAFDRLPDKVGDEFQRKVRTLAGNFQLFWRLPLAALPGYSPVAFQFVSHKLLRLALPWALLAMLVSSYVLGGPLYETLFLFQGLGYALAVVGLIPPVAARVRLAAAGASFLILNAAAFCAFWIWVTRQTGRAWQQASYEEDPTTLQPAWAITTRGERRPEASAASLRD